MLTGMIFMLQIKHVIVSHRVLVYDYYSVIIYISISTRLGATKLAHVNLGKGT